MIIQFWLYAIAFVVAATCLAHAHPDAELPLEGRIKRHGYPVEIHSVTTEDDYILGLYRIPHGIEKRNKNSGSKSAVLLAHGMGGAPHNWVFLGKKDSLPYYLADRGFDVWLVSTRGDVSPFGTNHKKYDWNNDPKYWDYSLHEIGVYDFAATLDYVTSHTNQSKVFFVGHSMAATQEFFILLSERPEYNNKIKIGVQYAGTVNLKRMEYSLALLINSLINVWKGLINYLGMSELLPHFQIINRAIIKACQDPMFHKACTHLIETIGGSSTVLMEDEIVGVALSSLPRSSARMALHFMENANSGMFRKYNYGAKKNQQLYGQKVPPTYNLKNCRAPVAFFYSSEDIICVKGDVYESMNELPNVIFEYEVQHPKFNHVDYLVARNSTHLVYEPTYKLLRDYDNGKIPAKIGKRSIPEY